MKRVLLYGLVLIALIGLLFWVYGSITPLLYHP